MAATYVTTTVTADSTAAVTASTTALATSTRVRRGSAAYVTRIVPWACSWAKLSTPIVPNSSAITIVVPTVTSVGIRASTSSR